MPKHVMYFFKNVLSTVIQKVQQKTSGTVTERKASQDRKSVIN